MDIEKQYKLYKERMFCRGTEFLIISFEEFKETIRQAEKKKGGKK